LAAAAWQNIMGQLRLSGLTPRQRQVAELLARGYSNKQIAARLCVSVRTVESHRANIYEKLGISSIRELYVIVNPVPVVLVLTSHPDSTSIMIGQEIIELCQKQLQR
jgi:DNA-binding NarL/FixJ family response regulator